jgi:hypothetical protein
MAIKSIDEKIRAGKIEIDLTGSQGNAFVLLGCARDLSKQLGIDPDVVHEQMTVSDYDNLVEVFDSYFGDYVNLYR